MVVIAWGIVGALTDAEAAIVISHEIVIVVRVSFGILPDKDAVTDVVVSKAVRESPHVFRKASRADAHKLGPLEAARIPAPLDTNSDRIAKHIS